MAFIWILLMMSRCIHVIQTEESGCRFEDDEARCSGMTYIPPIPPNIRRLVLSENNFSNITQSSFMNITKPTNIHVMRLSFCGIKHITSDAFNLFFDLKELDLSDNYLSNEDVKFLLPMLAGKLKLRSLLLKYAFYMVNLDEIFSLLNSSPSASLSLQGNVIERIPYSTLQRVYNVEVLKLGSNRLSNITFPEMKSLEKLDLSFNVFLEMPTFCLGNASLTPNLKFLYFNHNTRIYFNKDAFKCLPGLLEVQLNENNITSLDSDMFIHNPTISSFVVSTIVKAAIIQPYAFRSPTLKKIRMEGFFPRLSAFKGLPSLNYLEIYSPDISYLPEEAQFELFSPLTALVVFKCLRCHLHGSSYDILRNKPHLQSISIRYNTIGTLSLGKGMRNLQILDFGNNRIMHVFKEGFSAKLQRVDISNNPFLCDCDLVWFIDWLKETNTSKLVGFPRYYKCASPPRHAGKLLTDVHFTYFECHHFSTVEWIGMVAGPLLCVILLLTLAIYRNRWNIKHYMYLLRKRRNYVQIEDRDYEYDAFVAYNQENSDWVVRFLLPLLEGEFHLNLCVHDRDFRAGAFINDNIVECMSKSRKIILVISNAFAKSDWCMFELKIANSFHIVENVELVAVILEELQARNIDRSLKLLLETTTYLEWTEDNAVGHELFLTKLKDAMGL